MMTSPPSSTAVITARNRAASALRMALLVGAAQSALTTAGSRLAVCSAEIMTSRYRASALVTIWLSCSRGGEIPTRGRLGALPTTGSAVGSVEHMIEIHALTKRYGATTAVSDLTFTVRPGTVTVNGRPPRMHTAPLRELGGMLDPRAVHPSRSAYHHLLALAQTNGIRRSRVDEVIDAVGLREVAGRAAGKFSLGMSQRLGIAAALLGDPATVVLDEPVNGLDVEGIRWIRTLLADLAARGKTVFVSSHLMSEIAQTATQLIVIGRGRLIADTSVAEFIAAAAPAAARVRVRSSDQDALAGLLRSPEVTVEAAGDGALLVSGLPAGRVGAAAAAAGITVLELTTEQASLEDAFVDLTQDAAEFRAMHRPSAGPSLEESK